MLTLDRVNVFYGGIHALRDLSIAIREGEVVTLIGANGAGKSTTLRAISGLVPPRSGRVTFDGEDITGAPAHTLVARGISMSPEGRGVFANLTVLENLEMGAYRVRDRQQIAQDLERGFSLFPRLKERLKQRAGTLSGGEQQMLAMARALMSRPRLLLLDEPSLGLAPIVCQTIFSTIDAIKAAGTTVLLVEQNASVALRHSDRGYVLETGAVIFEGAAADIAADPRVRQAYLGE
ncbi:MAG TPA: ABC transporter ATP-binding protein [Vicinamibacterales bacterium]|jgi:branched-chain amino acid transport system ATP-binding protein|nr:ABC transporter ATP-binding protein [Vicinamibacterales bacterium]